MRRLVCLCLLLACQNAPLTGSLSGKVFLDAESDASGVSVVAIGPATATATTEVSGRWTLPNLPAGSYALELSAHDTRERTRAFQVLVQGDALAPDVHFTPVGAVRGSVTVAASVFVEGTGVVASSGSDGSYQLDSVPVGVWTVGAVAPGYQLATQTAVVVRRGQTTTAPPLTLVPDGLPMVPVAPLTGVALRLGRSDHSGTQVTALGGTTQRTTQTAADGRYHFDAVATGVYSLRFDYDGHSETIPQVLALAGSEGQIIDGALFALESHPLQLPEGRRISPLADFRPWHILDHDHIQVADGAFNGSSDLLRLRSISLATGDSVTLDEGVFDFSPYVKLSADRQRLLYQAQSGSEMRVLPAAGGMPVRLSSLIDYFESALFSPDGGRVLFRGNDGALQSVSASGGAVTPLVAGSSLGFLLHPDGQRLVYQWCDGGDCRVSIRALDGQDTPVDLLLAAKGAPLLTADGAYLVVISNRDYTTGVAQILAAATDGSGSRTLWDGVTTTSLVLSPDGKRAALFTGGSQSSSDLRVANLTGSDPPTLIASGVSGAAFSRDGTRIVYTVAGPASGVFSLAQQPSGGGTPQLLGERISQYQLSPQYTAFADNLDLSTLLGRLVVADAAGKTTILADAVRSFAFTPDGARLLFSAPDPSGDVLRTVPAGGGVPVTLAPLAPHGLIYPSAFQPSPAGSSVAVSDPNLLVRVVPAAGGTAQPAGIGKATWIDEQRLVIEQRIAAPYSFQTGIYVWDVTP